MLNSVIYLRLIGRYKTKLGFWSKILGPQGRLQPIDSLLPGLLNPGFAPKDGVYSRKNQKLRLGLIGLQNWPRSLVNGLLIQLAGSVTSEPGNPQRLFQYQIYQSPRHVNSLF